MSPRYQSWCEGCESGPQCKRCKAKDEKIDYYYARIGGNKIEAMTKKFEAMTKECEVMRGR